MIELNITASNEAGTTDPTDFTPHTSRSWTTSDNSAGFLKIADDHRANLPQTILQSWVQKGLCPQSIDVIDQGQHGGDSVHEYGVFQQIPRIA
jgi:hypothetical protein